MVWIICERTKRTIYNVKIFCNLYWAFLHNTETVAIIYNAWYNSTHTEQTCKQKFSILINAVARRRSLTFQFVKKIRESVLLLEHPRCIVSPLLITKVSIRADCFVNHRFSKQNKLAADHWSLDVHISRVNKTFRTDKMLYPFVKLSSCLIEIGFG